MLSKLCACTNLSLETTCNLEVIASKFSPSIFAPFPAPASTQGHCSQWPMHLICPSEGTTQKSTVSILPSAAWLHEAVVVIYSKKKFYLFATATNFFSFVTKIIHVTVVVKL